MKSISIETREKLVVGGSLLILSVVAWVNTFYQAQLMPLEMTHAQMGMSTDLQPIFPGFGLLLFLSTWSAMMIAMMLPSAVPVIMSYLTASQKRQSAQSVQVATALFALGYVVTWGGLGLLAYAISALQPIIATAGLVLVRYSVSMGGAVLIIAGAYQFTALKNICLTACRTPQEYIVMHWRQGLGGALLMGLQHGLYCVGCCWALMATMFVVGIMNLAGMALLTLVTYVEKTSKQGVWLSQLAGIALIATGLVMVVHNLL